MEILGHTNILQPNPESYQKIINDLYSDFWIKKPSSGISSLILAMEQFPDQDICAVNSCAPATR